MKPAKVIPKIKKSTIANVLPLRHRVLRCGKPMRSAYFKEDSHPATFHLSAYIEGNIVGVITLIPHIEEAPHGSYQIRGMAVEPAMQGRGIGMALLEKSLEILQALNVDTVWCNAREKARGFYKSHGFKETGGAFHIEGVGKHYRMVKIFD